MNIYGTGNGEYLAGGHGDDVIFGYGGNDTLDGKEGNDQLYGGRGGDILTGGHGSDQLVGDKLMLATDSAEAIRRLYLATLDRQPDDNGWGQWTARLDQGWSLEGIAWNFTNSPEFQAKYGALSNADFVRLLYVNVLDRYASDVEVNNWLDAMNKGLDREHVVTGFSQSPEFRHATNEEVQAGQVYRLYSAVFGRQPDSAGYDGWLDHMANGVSISDVAGGFVHSAEFQQTYGSVSNVDYIKLLYQNVLNRQPSQPEINDWNGRLDAGYSRSDVLLGFSNSAEYMAAKQGELVNYMQTAAPQWADYLDGGAGGDALSGGRGSDTYIFVKNDTGENHVYDYEAWDFARFDDYYSVAEVLQQFTQQGNDAVFDHNGQTIVFHDTKIGEINII